MPIAWNEESRELHLSNALASYVMRVLGDGSLGHVYFGPALPSGQSFGHLPPHAFETFSDWVFVDRIGDSVAFEYPTTGTGDYRAPALVVRGQDGSKVIRLEYVGHRIAKGKPVSTALPMTYVESDDESDTVDVVLADPLGGTEVTLTYTVRNDLPVITRSARIRNRGDSELWIECAMSAALDLPDADWTMVHLSGAWARERQVVERPLRQGLQSIGSQRGRSSHEHNPFLMLRRATTTEEAGEALGFSLVYSGNFLTEVEVSEYASSRVRLGIHPDSFSWLLKGGAEFQTPEAVMVYSETGIGPLSDALHRLFRERLARGRWRDRSRPILINNWEATFFDVRQDRVLELAQRAQQLGIELFVLDDGWFGRRDDDTTSLGDWAADARKLPDGLGGLGRAIRDMGMDFGLWIEPEMISARSQLYEDHPDWVVGAPRRPRSESRNQLVLDLSRTDVVDHLFKVFSEILGDAPISYIKWDMNRSITEPYSSGLPAARQDEFFHRYVLGVYELYRRVTDAFPEVLFESCASGGGRFDPGLLAYAPQGWPSSSTDPAERLRIQWGASLAYPVSAMGAHVTPTPNWIVGRSSPAQTSAAIAFYGVFGYELDLLAIGEARRAEIADEVKWYKERRELFQFGRFIRLRSPFSGRGAEAAWMSIAPDGSRAVAAWYRMLAEPNPSPARLRLRGLKPEASYRVSVWPGSADERDHANEGLRSGAELMSFGLFRDVEHGYPEPRGDHDAVLFELQRV